MNKFVNKFVAASIAVILTTVIFSGAAFGQTEDVVRLPNTPKPPDRKPFQARVFVTPEGIGNSSAILAIPEGKRLIIENVSVIGRVPSPLKLEVNFSTYMDNDGDGVGGIEDITFHRIAMIDQGVFSGTAISVFNQKMLVFADSKIGDVSYAISVQARLNGTPPPNTSIQVQFTFSGYLEDLPSV